jgi:hypothetical protein
MAAPKASTAGLMDSVIDGLTRFSHSVRSEAQRQAGRFKAHAGSSPEVR